jgi:hypothetical protein
LQQPPKVLRNFPHPGGIACRLRPPICEARQDVAREVIAAMTPDAGLLYDHRRSKRKEIVEPLDIFVAQPDAAL